MGDSGAPEAPVGGVQGAVATPAGGQGRQGELAGEKAGMDARAGVLSHPNWHGADQKHLFAQ
eukprot:3826006-Alexandrium_andersonii.AAC.1